MPHTLMPPYLASPNQNVSRILPTQTGSSTVLNSLAKIKKKSSKAFKPPSKSQNAKDGLKFPGKSVMQQRKLFTKYMDGIKAEQEA